MSAEGKSQIERFLKIAHKLYQGAYLRGWEGNLSCRLENGNVLLSATSICKGDIISEDLVEVNLDGEMIRGSRSPSSDMGLHLLFYRQRPEVNACVHAHPVYATLFSVLGEKEEITVLPEMEMVLGRIAFLNYTPPETQEVPKVTGELLKKSNVFILRRHGALTLGESLEEAYLRMETLERCAQVAFLSNLYLKARPSDERSDPID